MSADALSGDAIGTGTIARSAMWRALELVGVEVSAFVFMLVLVRLLAPDDYGIVGTAGVFFAAGQVLVARGLPDALIQRHDLVAEHVEAAFWANLALGAVVAGLLLAVAQPLAWLMDKPLLAPVLMALAPLIVVFAALNIYVALLRRRMRFKALAARSIVGVVAAGVAGVVLAFRGAAHWSLVGQQVVHAVLGLTVLMIFSPWRPRFRVSLPHWREVFAFGARISGASFTDTLARHAGMFILACFLSAATMGYYFVALRVFSSMSLFTYWSVSELGLPVLSRLQPHPDAHRKAAYTTMRIAGLICMPIFVGVVIVAEPLISTLVGARWSESVLPLQLLAGFGLLQAFQSVAGLVLTSAGRADMQVRITLQSAALTTILLAPAAPFGLVPALAATGVGNLIAVPLLLRILRRELGLSGSRLLRDQLPALGATAVMAAAVLTALHIPMQDHSTVRLLAGVLVGALAYAAALPVFAMGFMRELLGTARRVRQERQA